MSAREAYRQYREAVTACKGIFARGGNVTGDYGEHLVKQLYGVLLKTPGVENVTEEFRQCNP